MEFIIIAIWCLCGIIPLWIVVPPDTYGDLVVFLLLGILVGPVTIFALLLILGVDWICDDKSIVNRKLPWRK